VAFRDYVRTWQGSSVRADLRAYLARLQEIAALESSVRALDDAGIERDARALRLRAHAGEPLAVLRPRLFALAREAARRALDQRPFDEQMIAAMALDDGHVVEMQTGEGKTLAAVMPAAINALAGNGAHVLTFNDYLARRDAEWMGPIYRRLGLSVAHVAQGMDSAARHAAYRADVTYVTAKEAGFDRLRDGIAMSPADLVHRPFHFALIDEADSLLIDEATVPLVIAGRVESDEPLAPRLAALVSALHAGADFETDEARRNVGLTDRGIERVERALACGPLHEMHNLALLTAVNCALHARVLLTRDVDYIVGGGRIQMVDGHTGRVVLDRRWPDGLQAALEAKEGLARREDGQVLASLTLQRFFHGYSRLCGMTGTARDAAVELKQTYGLDVLVIPPHRPAVRLDRDDEVFETREAKEEAVVSEIARAHGTGRPVLVGTASVAESERLADRLQRAGVACAVLNARNDAEEAAIVADAGAVGAVTISTNMAGRGTDIRLGGRDEAARDRAVALGGLYVIGTNRHESRRVDLQLRGRAGRQGDPGESRFFVSFEDDMLVKFGGRAGVPSSLARGEIAHRQRVADGQNFDIRLTLARYAGVVEHQYEQISDRRRAILMGDAPPAERTIALLRIDRAWRDHLAYCADVREGIHLSRLGGADPLAKFTTEAIRAFAQMEKAIDEPVDLDADNLKAPSSTWTYLINDDPFKHRIGIALTGPGGVTRAIYAGAMLMPLVLLWGIVEKYVRRKNQRN
jgi:preprotein translocase subunit SecA